MLIKATVARRIGPHGVNALRRVRAVIRSAMRAIQPACETDKLIAQLRTLGICPGDVLMVHSSLGRLGNIRGGAMAVIQAMQGAVGEEGTILMPGYGSASDMNRAADAGEMIDLRSASVTSGTIPETFCRTPGVVRSSHPFASVSVWGKDALWFASGHDADSRICHIDSPIGRLWRRGGKVVGLGITMGPVSYYHVIEDTWPGFPIDAYGHKRTITYVDFWGNKVTREIDWYDARWSCNRIDAYTHIWIRDRVTEFLDECAGRRTGAFAYGGAWVVGAAQFYDAIKRLAERGITIYSTETSWRDIGAPSFK